MHNNNSFTGCNDTEGDALIMEKKTVPQTEANKKWESKNKEYSNYLKARTATRSFIRNKATEEDLVELLHLIQERRASLAE